MRPAETGRAAMGRQMREAREAIAGDETAAALMGGLRGENLDVSDFAAAGQAINLVEVDDSSTAGGDALPLTYDPDAIAAYWSTRPVAMVKRVLQVLGIGAGFLSGVVSDLLRDKLGENDVLRARQLREILTSLGPAYIKIGQALSIRPDLLSPAAMNEMQVSTRGRRARRSAGLTFR